MIKSRQAKWRAEKKSQGLCIQCGKKPLMTKNHCPDCVEINRVSSRNRYREKNGIDLNIVNMKRGRPRISS
jgi:hypothetical protein